MKKILLFLMCGVTFSLISLAQQPDTLRFDRFTEIPPIENGGDDGGLPHPKSPVTAPVVAQSGHTLYIISGCDGAGLVLIDEDDDEAYSTTILEGTTLLVLPEWLQGTFELRILSGQYIFYTEIEL